MGIALWPEPITVLLKVWRIRVAPLGKELVETPYPQPWEYRAIVSYRCFWQFQHLLLELPDGTPVLGTVYCGFIGGI